MKSNTLTWKFWAALGSPGFLSGWTTLACKQTQTQTHCDRKRHQWYHGAFYINFWFSPDPVQNSKTRNRNVDNQTHTKLPINEVEALFQNIQDQFLFSTRKPEKSQPTRHHSWVLSWNDFQFVFCFHFIYSKNTFMLISNSRKVRKEFRTLM